MVHQSMFQDVKVSACSSVTSGCTWHMCGLQSVYMCCIWMCGLVMVGVASIFTVRVVVVISISSFKIQSWYGVVVRRFDCMEFQYFYSTILSCVTHMVQYTWRSR